MRLRDISRCWLNLRSELVRYHQIMALPLLFPSQASKSANRLKRPALPAPSAPAAGAAAGGSGTTAAGAAAAAGDGGSASGGGALQLLLSRDGEFVRNILLDEVAKGASNK